MNRNQPSPWRRLDNAAKIFPPTSTRRDTKVFRFSCQLTETIEPAALQKALDTTLELFPLYRSILRKGLFWYFLEESDIQPLVEEEHQPVCARMRLNDHSSLLFQVTYYRRRINLEVYHALSDGTGALHFFRTLICYYLSYCYPQQFPGDVALHNYDASRAEQLDDSYQKYYSGRKLPRTPRLPAAYRLKGALLPDYRLQVVEGMMSVKAVVQKSKSLHVTVTAFLSAVLLCAIHEQIPLRQRNRNITLSLPVNLRNHFPSATARNFFSVVKISHNFQTQGSTFEEVLASVSSSLKEKLTPENLAERMDSLSALEHNMLTKMIPLVIKNPFMKLGSFLADRGVTAQFSNIGKVDMPEIYRPYIRLFDLFTSTQRLQGCAVSFGDNLVISFTCPLVSTQVQCAFFRMLVQMGIPVTISANQPSPTQEVL